MFVCFTLHFKYQSVGTVLILGVKELFIHFQLLGYDIAAMAGCSAAMKKQNSFTCGSVVLCHLRKLDRYPRIMSLIV